MPPSEQRESFLQAASTATGWGLHPDLHPVLCVLSKPQTAGPMTLGCSTALQPVFCFALLLLGTFQNSHYFTRVLGKLISFGENP